MRHFFSSHDQSREDVVSRSLISVQAILLPSVPILVDFKVGGQVVRFKEHQDSMEVSWVVIDHIVGD